MKRLKKMPKKTNKIKSETFSRYSSIDQNSIVEESRKFSAAFSTETEFQRFFGNEKLIHTEKAVNMERAIAGMTLLFNHDQNKPIGRTENVRLEDNVLRGDIIFNETPLAEEIFRQVQGNFLRDISLGYKIQNYKDVVGGIHATRWMPLEVSIVTVPADINAGINRNFNEGDEMPDEKKEESGVQVVSVQHDASVKAGMKREQERQVEVRSMFNLFVNDENPLIEQLLERCLSDFTITPDLARSQLLEVVGQGYETTSKIQSNLGTKTRSVELDESDKFAVQVENAIAVRAGVETDPVKVAEAHSTDLMSLNLVSVAREVLKRNNQSIDGFDAMGLIGETFIRTGGAHSSSDFPALLENVARKAMAKGYGEAPSTWREWAAVGSVSDFKPTNMITLSEFSDLEVKVEGSEYKHGMMKDKKEQIAATTQGKMFAITREAIINDDLGALSRAPTGMGQAAGRSINALAYSVLTSNPALQEDGTVVFHADHNNIGTAGAISETTIDELRKLMATQRGLLAGAPKKKASSQILDIPPKYLIVPKSLELAANKAMRSDFATDSLADPNMVKGLLQVISSAYLDAVSETAYYVLADQNQYDTVMVAFLNGNQSPYLESQNGWNRDGVEFKVRIDVGASWLDFRAATYNAGA